MASSVLEALALRVPTVAAENGTRPAGVVTFRGHDPVDLAGKLQYVINERHGVVASIPSPEIHDTLREEIAVLTGAESGNGMKILHVLHHSLPHIDGYSIRSKQIIDFQRSIGIDVRVLTSAQHEAEVGRPAGANVEAEVIDGVVHHLYSAARRRGAPTFAAGPVRPGKHDDGRARSLASSPASH